MVNRIKKGEINEMKIVDDNGKEIEFRATNVKKNDDTLTVVQIVNPLLGQVIPYEVQQDIEYQRQAIEKMFKEHGVNALVIYVPNKNHFAKFDTLKKNKK